MLLDCRLDRRSVGDERAELAALTRERLAWTAGAGVGLETVRELRNGQWALLVLDVVQRRVDAGGFGELFARAGEYAEDMVAAARLVEGGDYVPLLDAARSADLWDDCDATFAEITGWGTDLVDCAVAYARKHPEEFFLDEADAARDEDDFVARVAAATSNAPAPPPPSGTAEPPEIATPGGRPLPRLLARLYAEASDGGWGGALPLSAVVAEPRALVLAPGLRVRTDSPALPVERNGDRVAAGLRGWLEAWLAR